MRLDLTLSQITNLCVNDFIELEVEHQVPDINQAIYVKGFDVAIHGFVTKVRTEDGQMTVRIERVDTGLQEDWFSCVRALNKVDLQEANVLIHMMLDKLCKAGKWSDIDTLIDMIDPENEDLDIIMSFLVVTGRASKHLHNRSAFCDAVYPRLKPAITTWGVLDRLMKN
jgi:hypothetical protein